MGLLSKAPQVQGPRSSIWLSIGFVVAAAIIAKIFIKTLYNILWHPLKDVPGPFAAKVIQQYMSISVIKGTRAHTLLKLHEKYGPYVRIAPNEVSIQDHEIYRKIYNHTASLKEETFYKNGTLTGHESIFTLRNKDQHAARRKMQNQPYSQQAINENEPLIAEMVGRLVKRTLEESSSSKNGTVDVYPLCRLFSLEVICRAAFNQDIGEHSTQQAMEFLLSMEDAAKILPICGVFPLLRHYRLGECIPGALGHAFAQQRRWEETTRKLFRAFRSESQLDKSGRFIATPLLLQKDEYLGRTLTEDEAIEESMGLAFAGSGTTSTTIVYILYHLSRPENRACQLRLREEVQSTGSGLDEVKDLPYLNAVIKEAMRLNPSLIGTLPRTLTQPVTISKDREIVLPPDTDISMQNYVHQRDPEVYSDPHSFNPERWIGLSLSSKLEKALTPYSLGPRNCIGQNLAKAELLLAVSTIFRRLDIQLEHTMQESEMEMEDRFAAIPRGRRLLLQVKELSI